MALGIRAKTVIKLESDTIRMDLQIDKGVTLTGLINTLTHLVSDLGALETVRSNLAAHRATKVTS